MSKSYGDKIKIIKRPKKFFRKLALVLLFLIVFMGLFFGGVGLANLLTNKSIQLFKNDKITLKRINYYAIHFGEYESESDALNCSIWTASSGGSAYIFQEEKFFVLGQLYVNIDDAQSVLNNFNSDLTYAPNIVQFKTRSISFTLPNISASDKKTIDNDINLIFDTINNVLKISNNLDKSLISNVSASSEVNSLKSKLKVSKLELKNINSNYNSEGLDKIINFFMIAEDCLDVCTTKLLTNDSYNSVCKYCACELFFNYYDFVKNFDK